MIMMVRRLATSVMMKAMVRDTLGMRRWIPSVTALKKMPSTMAANARNRIFAVFQMKRRIKIHSITIPKTGKRMRIYEFFMRSAFLNYRWFEKGQTDIYDELSMIRAPSVTVLARRYVRDVDGSGEK